MAERPVFPEDMPDFMVRRFYRGRKRTYEEIEDHADDIRTEKLEDQLWEEHCG